MQMQYMHIAIYAVLESSIEINNVVKKCVITIIGDKKKLSMANK